MLQADFFHTILQGTHFETADLDRRVEMLRLQIRPQWPVCLISMRMPQGERFLDEVWRYGSERLENALRNIFERDEPDMSYVLQVLNPHHMRLLAYPKTRMVSGEVELHTKNQLHRSQGGSEGILRSGHGDPQVYRLRIALCALRAGGEN